MHVSAYRVSMQSYTQSAITEYLQGMPLSNDTRPIRFFHRGQIAEVDGVAPTRTVLDWLREDARCTGTKEGCNEGDCGACTVSSPWRSARWRGRRRGRGHDRRRPEPAHRQRLHPVPAHARRQGAVHGRGPEDRAGGALHPVQQAMVDCHGSQCGFCTPGFVMSLSALLPAPLRGRQHADAASNWPTSCPATCAAAPATGRSSMPASGCSSCRRRRSTRRRSWPRSNALKRATAIALRSRRRRSSFAPRTLDELATRFAAEPQARAASPARPTSACGSTSSSAPCRD